MIRLSTAVAPEQHLVRKVVFTSETHQNVALAVTLEYIAPESLREQHEKSKLKIVGNRRTNNVEELTQLNDRLNRDWQKLLAKRVLKVEGLTFRNLKNLISLDPAEVKKAGGLDTEIPLDTADTTALTDEEKKGFPGDVLTKGDAARDQIAFLIKVHPGFRQFIETVIIDVSFFQDEDWAEQAKN